MFSLRYIRVFQCHFFLRFFNFKSSLMVFGSILTFLIFGGNKTPTQDILKTTQKYKNQTNTIIPKIHTKKSYKKQQPKRYLCANAKRGLPDSSPPAGRARRPPRPSHRPAAPIGRTLRHTRGALEPTFKPGGGVVGEGVTRGSCPTVVTCNNLWIPPWNLVPLSCHRTMSNRSCQVTNY